MDRSSPSPQLSWDSTTSSLAQYSTICTCGRSFAQLNAYANHQRTCNKRKKHLSDALAKAKELWTTRKRPCREGRHDEPLGFTPPVTSLTRDAGIGTWPAGEGQEPEHEFATSELSSAQTTFLGVECNPDSIECNVSLRYQQSLQSILNQSFRTGVFLNLYLQLMTCDHLLSVAHDASTVVFLSGFETSFPNHHHHSRLNQPYHRP
jgi:hypothetical protein